MMYKTSTFASTQSVPKIKIGQSCRVGYFDGNSLGAPVGLINGDSVGTEVMGISEGFWVGSEIGICWGNLVGREVSGDVVGKADGFLVGIEVS